MARKQPVDGGSVTEIEARFLPSSFSLVSDTFYCFLFPKVFGFGEKLEKKNDGDGGDGKTHPLMERR